MVNNSIEYRRCHTSDILMLKRLWALCFTSDTAEEIDAFFESVFPFSVAFAAFDGDTAVTMLYLLPAQVRGNGWSASAWYLYAGGTHPSYRSQGHYRQLMNAARDWAYTSEAVAIYLRPADEGLFQYYASLGYVQPIYTYPANQSAMIGDGQRISIDEYLNRRELSMPASILSWEPIRPIVRHFVGEDGYAVADCAGVCRLLDNAVVREQIPLSIDIISEHAAALWIPTTDDAATIDRIKRAISYSLFFGE